MLEHVPAILGEALRSLRPGLEKLVAFTAFADAPEVIAVDSPAFGHGAPIPAQYTEDGRKLSPPLRWRNVPAGTGAVALLIEDADSPSVNPLVHAIVPDLAAGDGDLTEGALTGPGGTGEAHALGRNSFMKAEYLPPDPPTGHGPHRYAFQVFALDRAPQLDPEPGRDAFVRALSGHVLAKGVLIGTYERG